MKCPQCAAICADTDRNCYDCKTSLRGGGGEAGGAGHELAARVATAFACIGACIAPMVADAYGPKRVKPRGIDWVQVNQAGIGGAVGGVLGMALGAVFCRKRREY